MLQANLVRPTKAHRHQESTAPAAAGEIFYTGAIVAFDRLGFLRPARDAPDQEHPAGIVVTQKFPHDPLVTYAALDNRNGSNGAITGDRYERCVSFDTTGSYLIVKIVGAPQGGKPAWIVDDETVSATPNQLGMSLGTFQHPGIDTYGNPGWWVSIDEKSRLVRDTRLIDHPVLAGAQAVAPRDVVELAPSAGALTVQKGTANGTADFVGVALHAANPGELVMVVRSGTATVKVKDTVALSAGALLAFEANAVRPFDGATDSAVVGRALDATPGNTDQWVTAEIWHPPALKI